MRDLYEQIEKLMININFNELWDDFNKCDFALYNRELVYFKDNVIPYDTRFIGNSCIEYEGRYIAIFQVDDIKNTNAIEVAVNLVQEMFHAHQLSTKECRYPDEIEALFYPQILENYQLKQRENLLLVAALESTDTNKKYTYLKEIIASRLFRISSYGELIKYEFIIETLEGSAEYCGAKALKQLSLDLYEKYIHNYIKEITSSENLLFDIRRCSYYTGVLFLLLLDEIPISFSKKITNEKLTIFEQIASSIDTKDVKVEMETYPNIYNALNNFYKENTDKFNNFYIEHPLCVQGFYQICGYDPMNMVRFENKILCSNFVILENLETKERMFLDGPVILELEDNTRVVFQYYILV